MIDRQINENIKLDLFELGLIIHFCITGGQHTFEDVKKLDNCEMRVKSNSMVLGSGLAPEARSLIIRLLKPHPNDKYVIILVLFNRSH